MKCIILFIAILFYFAAGAQEVDTLNYEDITDAYEDYTNEEEAPVQTFTSPDVLESTKAYKAENINLKKFDRKKWQEIVGETDYREKKKTQSGAQPVSSGSVPWSGELLRIISYIVIIVIVILLLYYVSKNISVNYKLSKGKLPTAGDPAAPVENIEDLDIHTLLQQALAERNFRLAVRLYYLGLLKKLNESGIIRWKKDKTNRDYLSELFLHQNYYEDVRKLTLAYETVWYGEHPLTQESFQMLATDFEHVDQKIQSPKTL